MLSAPSHPMPRSHDSASALPLQGRREGFAAALLPEDLPQGLIPRLGEGTPGLEADTGAPPRHQARFRLHWQGLELAGRLERQGGGFVLELAARPGTIPFSAENSILRHHLIRALGPLTAEASLNAEAALNPGLSPAEGIPLEEKGPRICLERGQAILVRASTLTTDPLTATRLIAAIIALAFRMRPTVATLMRLIQTSGTPSRPVQHEHGASWWWAPTAG